MKSLARKIIKVRRPMKIHGAEKRGQVFGRVREQYSSLNGEQGVGNPNHLHRFISQHEHGNTTWHAKTLNADSHRKALDDALPTITQQMMIQASQSSRANMTNLAHMAMDSGGYYRPSNLDTMYNMPSAISNHPAISNNYIQSTMPAYHAVTPFPGYPFLQYMSQNSLISAGVETTAEEMTRKFAKVVYNGEAKSSQKDKQGAKKIQGLEADMKKFGVRAAFCRAAEMIGYYGGCLIYIDNGDSAPEILKTPLYLDPTTFAKDSLQNFVVVDPINCSPGIYNTTDPTKANYFVPETWIILGKEIHKSRVLYFCGKEAPLLFKPIYNFFGVSSSQLALEYVENFSGNKESASRLLNNFSTTVLKTNMMGVLQGEGTAELQARLNIFIQERNNNGIFALDKEEEELQKIDTSLSGVTDIVRQALELIAAVFRIPAVKFLGISPSGFNATGEADINNFYDFIASSQEKQLGQNLETTLKILQLNRYGEIDENLSMEWCVLGAEEDKIKAETLKTKVDTLACLFDRNIVDTIECRKVLAEDKDGCLSFLAENPNG